jgi:hypothetical protein
LPATRRRLESPVAALLCGACAGHFNPLYYGTLDIGDRRSTREFDCLCEQQILAVTISLD